MLKGRFCQSSLFLQFQMKGVMNDFYWSFFVKRTMIEKISKKILPPLIDHLDVYDSSYLLYSQWFFIIKSAIL